MQTLAVTIILILAVGYAGWIVYGVLKRGSDPCAGCSGCRLKELRECAKQKNTCCCHKK